jgi:N-acyl-D-amino-acid deacylase
VTESRFDLLIRGAALYDGTGAEPRRADVALRGDRIASVGEIRGRAEAVIDASGLAVAPGFIDVHSHDDFAVFVTPEMEFKVMQGVTTDVVGNCGMGAAPFEAASVFAAAVHPSHALERWEGYAGYLAAVDRDPPSLNVAVLVGHGTVRATVMGNAARAADTAELGRMRSLVREGLDAGAVGLSTGLIYEPGRYARTEELVSLAREMTGTGALYATHMRNEGEGLLEAVGEALAIGEEAGVPVEISHHKAAGRESWGLVRRSLRLLEEARARGLDVTADQYPYTAGSTILAAVVQSVDRGSSSVGRVGEEDIVIASTPRCPEWEGRTLRQLAEEWGVSAVDAARRVLERESAAWVVMHSMDEEDVRTVMRHPTTMIGSDGIPTQGGKPHPRLYGTFPRVLGRYARDLRILSMEEAVYRMTGLPATKFRLEGRGFVREGAYADLVLFDPSAVLDRATYADPRSFPDGIRHVFVNGAAVVREGRHTGGRPGRALRRSGESAAAGTSEPCTG